MPQYIEAKSILSRLRDKDHMFGLTYNMNLYRGCQHGCIYCDTRSECYGIGDIRQISIKKNAIELLQKELASKQVKGTIGTGSMNDPYMPVEKEEKLTRKALEVIAKYKFPVHVITKSSLVTRDYDLLQQISKTYAAVSITITCIDDKLSKKLEPNAPSTSERFKAIEYLAGKGIYTGITLMPLLPYINDDEQNVSSIMDMAKSTGASYVIPMLGVTLRKGSRGYLYQVFEQQFPGIRDRYEKTFKDSYMCFPANYRSLERVFKEESMKSGIPSIMQFYKTEQNSQLSLF
ncbi:MAG: radical SAM protein [Prevotella sp.]|jgi:DNA repair photolyase|nr:radical SAM protein [Prevotella sp.]